MTVAKWLSEWAELFPGKRTADTQAHDAYMLAPFIAAHGTLPLDKVTPLLCQRWALERPGQVRYLRRAFDKAVLMRLIAENPWRLVELPKRIKAPRPIPTKAQVDKATHNAWLLGGWWRDFSWFCVLAAYSGARLGGLAGLRLCDVDLALDRMVVTEKGGKVRTVVLSAPARGACVAQFASRRGAAPDALLFLSPAGMRIDRGLVSRSWKEIRGDFDGPFHSLKHFAGTWLAEQGVDERDIAVQLGHTDAAGRPYTELVRRVYVHPDHEDALARIAERV